MVRKGQCLLWAQDGEGVSAHPGRRQRCLTQVPLTRTGCRTGSGSAQAIGKPRHGAVAASPLPGAGAVTARASYQHPEVSLILEQNMQIS